MATRNHAKLNRRIGQNHVPVAPPPPAPQAPPPPPPPPQAPVPIPGVQGLPCTVCGLVFYSPEQMIGHLRVDHEDLGLTQRRISQLCCHVCRRYYESRAERDAHQPRRCPGY